MITKTTYIGSGNHPAKVFFHNIGIKLIGNSLHTILQAYKTLSDEGLESKIGVVGQVMMVMEESTTPELWTTRPLL